MSAEEIKKIQNKFSACSTQNPGESRSKDKERKVKENKENSITPEAKVNTIPPEAPETPDVK